MTSDLIFELVELAISLAHAELGNDSGNVEQTLLDIREKADQALRDHTGEELDPSLIEAEDPA
jgi:hypothetical protein